MKLQLSHYRAIDKAEIDMDRIALVQGSNEQGKSSIIWGLRSVLLNSPLPDPESQSEKWLVKDLTDVVREKGPCVAIVSGTDIEGREFEARMVWPEGKLDTKGRVPFCSPIAAGVVSANFASMDEKGRTAALSKLLSGKVRLEDFKTGIDVSEKNIQAVFDLVKEVGWDAALHRGQDKLSVLKGHWQAATNETFGDQKMKTWRPAGWKPEMEELTEESAAALVEAAARVERELTEGGAVAASEIARLKAQVATLPALREAMDKANDVLFAAGEALSVLKIKRTGIPEPEAPDAEPQPCPHCGRPVGIVRGKLVDPGKSAVDKAGLEKARLEIAGLEGEISKAETAKNAADRASTLAGNDVAEATKAEERLKEVKDANVDAEAIAKARADLTAAGEIQKMVLQVKKASHAAKLIEMSLKIVEALKPTGIRKTVMLRELEAFNKTLATYSELFGIKPVQLSEDFTLRLGGRHYRNGSKSQKFRARIVIQVAAAKIDGSEIIIIDDDVDMDRRWYTSLAKLLLGVQLPAIVGVRFDTIEQCFQVWKSKNDAMRTLIKSYWVADATATLLKAPEAVEA